MTSMENFKKSLIELNEEVLNYQKEYKMLQNKLKNIELIIDRLLYENFIYKNKVEVYIREYSIRNNWIELALASQNESSCFTNIYKKVTFEEFASNVTIVENKD